MLGCTHSMHMAVQVPDGDVLIHTGDFTGRDTFAEFPKFIKWMSEQSHEHKILISGNHDEPFHHAEIMCADHGVKYLCDASLIIDGVKFYGSPWTPEFYSWHWMKPRGMQMKKAWDNIPDDTDVLVTHGPPIGCMDKTDEGVNAGCEELLAAVKRVKPKVHCFSHIHEGYGWTTYDGGGGFNVSIVNRRMQPVNEPVVTEITKERIDD